MRTKSNEKSIKVQTISCAVIPYNERLKNSDMEIIFKPDFGYKNNYLLGTINNFMFGVFFPSDQIIADKREVIEKGDYVAVQINGSHDNEHFGIFQFIGYGNDGETHFYSWEKERKKKTSVKRYFIESMYKIIKVFKCFDIGDYELELLEKGMKE